MRKVVIFSFILSIVCACSNANDGMIKVTGQVANAIPQGEIKLEKYDMGQISPVTTVYSDHNGNFEIELALESPGFYRIDIYGKQKETLILHKDDLSIKASGEMDDDIEITGSADMKFISDLYAYLDEYQVVVRDFNAKYIKARNEGDNALVSELTDEGMMLESQKIEKLKKMAWSLEGSIAPLLVTDFINNKEQEFGFLDSLGNKLLAEVPNSKDVEAFVNNLQLLKPAVSIGEIAPDISLATPDGGTMSLSDLRGSYVLLDFWAGWCRPCRAENPNVVRMYNKYHEKGFDVFSVSLDRTRKMWVDAIADDGLIWPNHVSDLKYFRSQAAMDYKVNAIPFALLLDPEGRVIGKNLRGRRLEAKLASIFGE